MWCGMRVADIVPKMTSFRGTDGGLGLNLQLGHRCLIHRGEGREEGIRSFLFALRKSAIAPAGDPYEEALQIKKQDFDRPSTGYLKERFKPFRDRSGRRLRADLRQTRRRDSSLLLYCPIASATHRGVTGNRREQDWSIVLVSSKDGSSSANLTEGFDKDMASVTSSRWAPLRRHPGCVVAASDRVGVFRADRKRNGRSSFKRLDAKIEIRIPMKSGR